MNTSLSAYWNSLSSPRRRSLTAVACLSFGLLTGEGVVAWQFHKMNTELDGVSERIKNMGADFSAQSERLDRIEGAIGLRLPEEELNPF